MVLEVGEKPQISIWDKTGKINIIPEAYTTLVTLIGYVAINQKIKFCAVDKLLVSC